MVDYQIHDVSEKDIKFGLWFLHNKKKIQKILLGILLLFGISTLGYGIYGFISYGIQLPEETRILGTISVKYINFADFRSKHVPLPLEISEPEIIYAGGQDYDFVAQVTNPNEDRGVLNLSYQFISGDFTTSIISAMVLPDQSIYLLSLGNKSDQRLNNVELKILDTKWQSIWKNQPVEDINIVIEEPKFKTAPDLSRSWVEFTATNQSLKNIWEVTWQTVVFSGRRIAGVNQITTEGFLAGETKNIELSWFEKLPRVTQINVVPIINIYDQDSFFEVPGEASDYYY